VATHGSILLITGFAAKIVDTMPAGNRQATPASTSTNRKRNWRRAWSYGSFATS
jgi:hypothetical protein